MPRTGFPSSRFQRCASGQTLPATVPGRGGASARTAISRVIVPQSAGARSRASVARHVPAAGDLTSASQKYGGPPWRSRDRAATLPSGAISESSPSSGFSAVNMTRSGAPFHGAIGEGSTASSAASSQRRRALGARVRLEREKEGEKRTAIGSKAVAAAANRRAGNNGATFVSLDRTSAIMKLCECSG